SPCAGPRCYLVGLARPSAAGGRSHPGARLGDAGDRDLGVQYDGVAASAGVCPSAPSPAKKTISIVPYNSSGIASPSSIVSSATPLAIAQVISATCSNGSAGSIPS